MYNMRETSLLRETVSEKLGGDEEKRASNPHVSSVLGRVAL